MLYWCEEMLRFWKIASFTQELLGQPNKIKGNTTIATLSKFVWTHPPPPQQQFAQNEKKM